MVVFISGQLRWRGRRLRDPTSGGGARVADEERKVT
jgi:hypothetical protein